MSNIYRSTVVSHTKSIFARHGILKLVISDNGPQFISSEYKNFPRKLDFIHDTSSPRYPESNGKAKRHIQTVKKTLKKTLTQEDDLYLALLNLRSSPGVDGSLSPAFILMGRQPRTLLSSVKISDALCKPSIQI